MRNQSPVGVQRSGCQSVTSAPPAARRSTGFSLSKRCPVSHRAQLLSTLKPRPTGPTAAPSPPATSLHLRQPLLRIPKLIQPNPHLVEHRQIQAAHLPVWLL